MRRLMLFYATVAVAFVAFRLTPVVATAQAELPTRLSDQQFWTLSQEMSEPDGSFRSDNLLSNELVFARVIPALIERTKPGGVYLGVGPEQNFSYIAAMKPRMVFITDVRRGNLQLQLMYKALFELSSDRAEFVSRLFTKPRPASLTKTSSAGELMNAYWDTDTGNEAAFKTNVDAVLNHLTKTHALPLGTNDQAGIAAVYRAFYWYGPIMSYSANIRLTGANTMRGTSYRDLMVQTASDGRGLSYLGSEEAFGVLKDLESKNLIVPVVGNFAGPKALRAVGSYVRDHGATVSAFYVSNVEQYLRSDNIWDTFCSNVATMPLDDSSVFIRPMGIGAASSFTVMSSSPTTGGSTSRSSQNVPIRLVAPSGTMTNMGLVPITGETAKCR